MIEYSPYIEGTLPAFSGISDIKIPFEMNPAVGKNEIKGFAVMIKSVSSSGIVGYLSTTGNNLQPNTTLLEKAFQTGVVDFSLLSSVWCSFSTSKLTSGEYYKIQIAYFDSDILTTGTNMTSVKLADLVYSTAGLARYIDTPDLFIDGLKNGDAHKFSYVGKYKTSTISEPVYSYRFRVYSKSTGKVRDDTGEILYNSFNDTISSTDRICTMSYYCKAELLKDVKYNIELSITTVNGYQKKIVYWIQVNDSTATVFNKAKLEVSNNRENGYVTIKMIKGTSSTPPQGNYTIFRKNSLDNYSTLENLIDFSITSKDEDKDWTKYEWRDLTVQYGVTYKYVLRPFSYTNKVRTYSATSEEAMVTAWFDDLFLGDANLQLAVRFNPKVSSLKETIQESKVETLGSKYPYFFRNGHLCYKEIPISGLISYLVDEEELFATKNSLGLNNTTKISTTGLTDYNILAERNFRDSVLEWINNGQPKLFRSPTEGNIAIRLMNISLSPNDTLGRMLYSFSATGYEMANNDYQSLYDLKLADCVIKGKKDRGYFS